MVKDDFLKTRVNSQLKRDAKNVLSSLGMNVSEAINIYLSQIVQLGGIPFPVELPNAETVSAIEEVEADVSGKAPLPEYNEVDKLFKDLESDHC